MAIDNIPGPKIFKQRDVRETKAGGISEANFNTDDFTVASGVVSLKNKTSYWTCTGLAFRPISGDSGAKGNEYTWAGGYQDFADSVVEGIDVHLPDGAVITGAIVYGVDNVGSDLNWFLYRKNINSTTGGEMATAAIDTEDTTISNATVDNSTYAYWLIVGDMAANDQIHGARITYTTDYD